MSDTPEKTRYSDEELQEFKKLILEKIETAKQNYELLKSRIMTDESQPTFKVLEEGASTLEKEEASQRAQRQMEFIKKLQGALVRIENKTYGICRVTGKLIPKERLMAVPHTTLSVEGKEIEQQQKLRRR
ncbi:MAG: TraR/DksA C4-type zinc finger protein [Sodaliphilus pleomorphus]|jgi:RNA polymerase-binding transcription factor DksA|uniref:TraR/DksA family transcriptional regulator n=1 Tax=Sodaliphilus pleomorphus TaxID=2606626 RepID=A0A6L5XAZ7_9BACT|nr:TraR/DksA C4-type zinc finger protein [Sodaliphilus pleomorphus]MCI5979458.1 TraR/DksA C4-type zinc finger protein [Muribaculaceae bacterium]MDY6251893.1 TraR/DksA C4-type zinc finger protein [Bacteroidales bacterium]MCI6169610.1 TraR/DksA C4-type zinc finger protein [Muribaculaceae bacterium]MDD6686642.1 TraR/DksA C4-type zinc finger protein [Sodaliphilus pleomorphus]MDD7065911.1 TraR/DksA C4-type zinc finger protein [Sodaliphilus pleomorphus]